MRLGFPVFMLAVASFYGGIAIATWHQYKDAPKVATINEVREMPIVVSRPIPIPIMKVMVIDTGISIHPKLKSFVQYDESVDYKDGHGHGTHVAGIIAFGNHMLVNDQVVGDPLCPEVEIYSCKYYEDENTGEENLDNTVACIERAIKEKMHFINYSGGGILNSEKEYDAYRRFVDQGGTVVVAAGNESRDLQLFQFYPASYAFDRYKDQEMIPGLRNFFVASAIDKFGEYTLSSNKHPKAYKELGHQVFSTLPNGEYGYMTGTSQAAPAVLHTILRQKCQQKDDLHQASK